MAKIISTHEFAGKHLYTSDNNQIQTLPFIKFANSYVKLKLCKKITKKADKVAQKI